MRLGWVLKELIKLIYIYILTAVKVVACTKISIQSDHPVFVNLYRI